MSTYSRISAQLGRVHGRHVDREADGAARQVVDEQLGRLDGDGGLRLDRRGAEVRRQDDIGHLQKRMVRRRRLLHENVEGGAGQVAGLEGVGQRLFVNDAAAGAVDDAGALAHQGHLAGADQVARLVGERRVDGEEIDLRQQSIEIGGGLDADLAGGGGGEERVEAEHLHVEAGGAAGDLAADAAEADDAERLAGQLRADELGALPLGGGRNGRGRRRRG